MSRSGYTEDIEDYRLLVCWRGAVDAAIRGRRGQAFLKEMLAALDALDNKRLIENDLENETGGVCAIGAVGRQRGVGMRTIDPDDYYTIAYTFGIAKALAREITYVNDEEGFRDETPEERYQRVRQWVEAKIVGDS